MTEHWSKKKIGKNKTVRPENLAPQDDSKDDAEDRRAIKLYLVRESNGKVTEKHDTNGDHAWAFSNDAYDQYSSEYGSPGDDAIYYTKR